MAPISQLLATLFPRKQGMYLSQVFLSEVTPTDSQKLSGKGERDEQTLTAAGGRMHWPGKGDLGRVAAVCSRLL